jgi:two-component system OmpR family response regulator
MTALPMTPGNKRLLIVDDNAELREQMRRYLSDYEFDIDTAPDAPGMDAVLAARPVDLVILDLMMPGEDGLSICRRLVQAGEAAVIMISAAGEEIDRVLGLELGADDYLPKPFSPRELLARARAVLRRRTDGPKPRGASPEFTFEGFRYNSARRELRAPDGTMILLTAIESSLLGTLLMYPQQVMTRDELLSPGQSDPESRAIDLLVSRLRRKLLAHGGDNLIRTQRGAGYLLACPVSRQ